MRQHAIWCDDLLTADASAAWASGDYGKGFEVQKKRISEDCHWRWWLKHWADQAPRRNLMAKYMNVLTESGQQIVT